MIYQADIRQHWDFVKPGLESICDRFHTGWCPEDVYADCKHGEAWLYLAEKDKGFMVVKDYVNQHTGERYLFVWVLYAYEGDDIIDRYMPALDNLAREHGYSKVRIESPRHGWKGKAEWREEMTTYCHEVPK